jgi:hypothetical protein
MTRPKLVGWLLALATVVIVMVNQRDVGLARDETVYIGAGAHYADWWIGLVTGKHGLSEAAITAGFGGPQLTDNNREHPPLMKTLFGFSERVLHRELGVVDEISAFRLPSAVMAGALVWLVYTMVLEIWGLAAGVLAALFVMFLPRALFHESLACFDAPTTTLWFATIYAYWRALADPRRRIAARAGIAWGLALATKHTAFFLPFAIAVHFVVVAARAARRDAGLREPVAIARFMVRYRPWLIGALVVLGPLTLVAVWPWLWFAPVKHLGEWLGFHLHHVHYNYEYLGHNWNAPRFPWHVALVTTLFTVPVATLAAAVIGAGVWIKDRAASTDRARMPALLLAVSAAASIGPFFLGTTPIFGAEKHWEPAIPTICIAAGVGAAWAARQLAGYVANLTTFRHAPLIATLAIGAVTVGASVTETVTAEPYALTWYNALAGGAPGGADLGMNRQFWGVAAYGVLPFLRTQAPPPHAPPRPVYTHDASPAWGWYQRLGLIPSNMPDAGWEQQGIEHSQLAFVVHELHFNRHDYLIWNSYGTVQPVFVLRSDGVPIVSVYRRPPLK